MNHDEFVTHLTEKLQNIVKSAVEQMPKEATNIRLIEGYRHSAGIFGTHSCWTEVEAVYKDDDGHEVGRVKTIDKVGGWQYSDPSNYILYNMGLYKPYSEDNLKSIKYRYEELLNNDRINPINSIYSDNYLIRLFKQEIIDKSKRNDNNVSVVLTFVLDYDYMETGFNPNVRYDKREYCIKPRISYGSDVFTANDCNNFFNATLILEECFKEFKENGIMVSVDYDMSDEDWDKISGHWRNWWDD